MHQTQIKSKDKALMKEVAIMEDKEVKQVWNIRQGEPDDDNMTHPHTMGA